MKSKNKNTGKVEFKDWQENQVSSLTYFYIAKYLGTLLGGNSAKVTFFYENGNVKELFGPDGDVYHFAKKIIFQKKKVIIVIIAIIAIIVKKVKIIYLTMIKKVLVINQ